MKTARLTKKMVSLTVAGSLSLSLLGAANGAAVTEGTAPDIVGHWAEQDIAQWMSQGLIDGYEDGSFQPDKAVTRAEFVALVNRAFGFTAAGNAAFKDLKAADWSYADFQKAVKAGYLTGFEDGSVHPNSPISRQEIALIVERLLGLAPLPQGADAFSDSAMIPAWSKGAIGAVEANGIMDGYEDHTFKPANNATRAEAVVILSHALKVKSAPVVLDKAGTVGPATGTQTIHGDVVVSSPGVTLRNTVVEGNLTFAAGIGEGDAVLDHVTVKGTTLVQGGGAHSIHFEDSVLLTIVVDKTAGAVRIVAEGSTTVATVRLQTAATLEEEAGLTGEGFTDVQLSQLLPAGSSITLLGAFDDVDVTGVKVRIDIPSGNVQHITVGENATGNDINLGTGARIVDLVLNAAIKVIGGGKIDTVQMNEAAQASSSFETQPGRLEDENGNLIVPKSSAPSGPSQQELDQRAADDVTALITALPATADLTLAANAAGVEAANAAFGKLSTAQKALVTTGNQTKLADAVARIAELKADKAAADAVIALIAALPEPELLRLEDQADITAAKDALGALTAPQKALVTNQDKLALVIAKIDALIAAANAVTAQITALPDPAVITLDNQTDVTAANAAFNALSAAQQDLVTNQAKLTQAVAKIEALIAAANAVTAKIAALPDPATITLDNQAAVTSARTAFDALSASQQALVTNQTKLTQAEARISTLIAAANAVTAQIAALPDPAAITLDNQTDVDAANAAFNALSAAQQDLVTNQAKLTQA
ncbi:S-layer homology domain-containing protein, partial [Paenibacillus glycinis]